MTMVRSNIFFISIFLGTNVFPLENGLPPIKENMRPVKYVVKHDPVVDLHSARWPRVRVGSTSDVSKPSRWSVKKCMIIQKQG